MPKSQTGKRKSRRNYTPEQREDANAIAYARRHRHDKTISSNDVMRELGLLDLVRPEWDALEEKEKQKKLRRARRRAR